MPDRKKNAFPQKPRPPPEVLSKVPQSAERKLPQLHSPVSKSIATSASDSRHASCPNRESIYPKWLIDDDEAKSNEDDKTKSYVA